MTTTSSSDAPLSSSSSTGSSSASASALTRSGSSSGSGSALQTSQGSTTIADGVVQKISGMAAREVNGVYQLGGGASRAFGALRERIPGSSQSAGQGVSVEVGERQAAEDVTQETYLKAWTTLRSFRGDSSLETWLYRIVINEAHNHRRRLPRTQPLPDADSPLAPRDSSADQQVVAEQRRAAVADAIAELPMRYRAPLVLHYFAGCSYAEVGRILSLSEVAAKVRVHRARRALTDRLQAWR